MLVESLLDERARHQRSKTTTEKQPPPPLILRRLGVDIIPVVQVKESSREREPFQAPKTYHTIRTYHFQEVPRDNDPTDLRQVLECPLEYDVKWEIWT